MLKTRLRWLAEIAALTLLVLSGAAQTSAPVGEAGAALVVKGAVKQELKLTLSDLKAMPRMKVMAKDHDGGIHNYDGVALQALLAKAGVPQGGDLRGKNMTLYVVAEASDGYHVVFSLAEMDEDFAGEQVVVVDTVDTKPLAADPGPLRLVVPGDKRQARWVKMLQSIEVVKVGPSENR